MTTNSNLNSNSSSTIAKRSLPSPTPRATLTAHDPIWQWIHRTTSSSTIQPPLNLSTGFVSYNPPLTLRQSHSNALTFVANNQYAPISGTSDLKTAIANSYSSRHKQALDPDKNVLVTSGAQEGLLSAVMAFVGPGDEVILIEPVFSMYTGQVRMAGGECRFVSLKPPPGADERIVDANDWKLDMSDLEAAVTPRTKMVYFNNPHNPLGKVFDRSELLALGNFCVRHSLILLSDEVYERVAFRPEDPVVSAGTMADGHGKLLAEEVEEDHDPFVSMASLSQEIAARTITAVSLGKLFNASGWRVGFVTGPEELVRAVENVHAYLAYSSSAPAQEAFAKGLPWADDGGWWKENARDLEERSARIARVLERVGLTYVRPAGAWFIFVNVSRIKIPDGFRFDDELVRKFGTRDWKVCYFLIHELGVASLPGSWFYSPEHARQGENWLRFGVCLSDEGLDLAEERLSKLKDYVV